MGLLNIYLKMTKTYEKTYACVSLKRDTDDPVTRQNFIILMLLIGQLPAVQTPCLRVKNDFKASLIENVD